MNIFRNHRARHNGLLQFSLFGIMAGIVGAGTPGAAQIITLADIDSVAQVSPNTQAGMSYWAIAGQQMLDQQWFWYGIGNGAVRSIDTISPAAINQPTGRELISTYNSGACSVSIDYLLTGGTAVITPLGGNAQADIGETIKIVNFSGSALPFHFYQYSFFNLVGGSSDIVEVGKNGRGLYNDALQLNSSDGSSMSETVTTPGANHAEVAPVGVTLAKLNSGGPVTLSDNTGPVGPGAVTWAFEWDFNIAPGSSVIISKDKNLQLGLVPEPSLAALVGVGMSLLAWRWRKRGVFL
jgi:hypothetical protein